MSAAQFKPVAIVGMSLRGPGEASDPEKFWHMLVDGRSVRTEIPKDRYNVDGFYHPDPERLGSLQVRHGHFMEDFKAFDAPFFSITAMEAKAIAPTHRLLLEVAYEAFENAGISLDQVNGTATSCYMGTSVDEFAHFQVRDDVGPSMYYAPGRSNSQASNRISWFFNLKGPSMTVDTACSSSLSAFHLGCQSIQSGETKLSIVGGANLILGPDISLLYGAARVLSPEGKCKMWDAGADGFGRGEGLGVVVLKALDDALKDGDTIRGVVLASVAQEDGRTPGIMLPSSEAQRDMICNAYELAGVDPAETGYVEAHGTGTQAGDPLEARALVQTIGEAPNRTAELYVGTAKTNIGHLEGAAGIVGLIKAALATERGLIPQNLWFDKLNPEIKLPEYVKVPVELTRWQTKGPRRASVNSFGFGGANAHVIIEDAASYLSRHSLEGNHTTVAKPLVQGLINGHTNSFPDQTNSFPEQTNSFSDQTNGFPEQTNGFSDQTNGFSEHTNGFSEHANGFSEHTNGFSDHTNGFLDRTNGINGHHISPTKQRLFLLSSQDKDGVTRYARTLDSYLEDLHVGDSDAAFMDNLAHTLASKRSVLPWKTFAVASSLDQLRHSLNQMPTPIRSFTTSIPSIAFVFTGQGAQWFAMGRSLFSYKVFQESMARSDDVLKSLGCPWSLEEELNRSEEDSILRHAEYSLPTCTALQIALVDLVESWGVRPAAVVGHSSGEMAAAYCAGLISHEAAMKVASLRGRGSASIVESVGTGGMLAVNASAETVKPRLETLTRGRAVVACFNSPGACTISGDKDAIDELQSILQQEQTSCTRLPVDVAYHSFHTEVASRKYGTDIAAVPHIPRRETIPMFSSVTGKLVKPDQMKPSYWVENFVKPVNFAGAVRSLLSYLEKQGQLQDRGALAGVLLEIGPHSALRTYLLDILGASSDPKRFSYATILRRKHDAIETALLAMGQLWVRGCPVQMDRLNRTTSSTKMLVDLPPYAWNHSLTFWEESHLSRAYHQRSKPRTDLLGIRVPSAPDPTWRNFLRCRESPWIREHRVHGNILYPAAGMIVMAIEAVMQVADPHEVIHSYELRDVSIIAALLVPDTDDGVEVFLQLHPRRIGTKSAPSSTLNEFVISSWSEDAQMWTTHARGLISATYKSGLSSAMQRELALEGQEHKAAFLDIKDKCRNPVRGSLYSKLEDIGMHYGPTFRNLNQIFTSTRTSYGTFGVPNTKATMPHGFEYPCVVHPVTLDSALHLIFPSISSGDVSLTEAIVPTSIERIAISNKLTGAQETLHGISTSEKSSYTSWTSSIIVVDESQSEPFIVIEGLRLSPTGAESSKAPRASCFEEVWYEDVDLLEPDRIKELVYQRTIQNEDENEAQVLDRLEYICLVYIYRALRRFGVEGRDAIPTSGFLALYLQWMQSIIKDFAPLTRDMEESSAELEAARESVAHSKSGDIAAQMIGRIGQNLADIFSHKIEPLQLMTEGGLLYEFYRHAIGPSYNGNVAQYVGLVADKKPGLSILEIGAGTGGTTFYILERLRFEGGESKASRYVFTDISPGFLSTAQERFSQDSSIMEFTTLNIEKDPMQQGFQPESFDIIVASNVLHATKSIQETLSHCRTLLKPGGKLVLAEVTIKRIFIGLIYGTLPGWWLGENDNRKGGPLLNVAEWDAALRKAEFAGVDLDARGDGEASQEPISLIVSTKPLVSQPPAATRFAIINSGTPASNQLCEALRALISSAGLEASVLDWHATTSRDVKDKYCLSFAEWEHPILAHLTDENWEILRQIILNSSGTLWVTGGASMETPKPLNSLMFGLSRAIRNENPGLLLATLDIDSPESLNIEEATSAIIRVAIDHSRGNSMDTEYALRGATVSVPRVQRSPNMDVSLRIHEGQGEPEPVSFDGCQRPLKLSIKTPGLLDTFRWIEDETHYKPLPDDWIEIRVKAVGLNFKDVLIAMGNINQEQLGLDVSGVVSRVGSTVSNFKPGDRVMAATVDAFATFVRFPGKLGSPIPDDMSFDEAASMPVVYLTAYHSLITTANLARGESILVHAAAGGVGQAAITIAKQIGAEIFATVGSEEKRKLLVNEYNISEDHIFSSRDTSFAKGIVRMTKGRGVDVVLNSLAGEALRMSWHCLADWGRFLEIGNTDILANTGLDMKPFLDNKSYFGINLSDFMNNPTPRVVAAWNSTASLMNAGAVRAPKPIRVFELAEVEKAFRYMQTGKHIGKIVVQVRDNDMVLAVPRTPEVGIQREATYVIAGLGGLCREIGRWLAENGAQHLILLSRSAASSPDNIEYAARLRKTYGINVLAHDCDVGDREALQSVLEQCVDLPPIRGCVTGAMALHDAPFSRLTANQVRTAVWPKVHGTVNLHELLPKDLDFFAMLSSLAGVIGNREQGNYGCGNIFQDRFATFRRSQGLRAMTIDVSYLTSVGFVADHYEYVDYFKAIGLKFMQNRDLHNLLSVAMQGTAAHPAQVMCGLPFNEHDERRYWIHDDRFAALRNCSRETGPGAGSAISLNEELRRCTDMAAAVNTVSAALVQRLARLMMMPEEDIDDGRPLNAYGVDSLVAVEVRNWITREMEVEVSVFEVMANVPMHRLASDLAGKTKLFQSAGGL